MTALMAAALDYAERGWPVFPCRPPVTGDDKTGKDPLTKHGFKDATTDPARITGWWTRWPDANIGLPTEDLTILDIDSEEALRKIATLAPGYRHPGPTVVTGRGYHLYFRNEDLRSRNRMSPKLDLKAIGGYVILPPSNHYTGATYAWAPGRGLDLALPPVPDWLVELRSPAPDPASHPMAPRTRWAVQNGAMVQVAHNQPRSHALRVAVELDLPLFRSGADRVVTNCVFGTHTDSTPSLTFWARDERFYCFGCDAWGDGEDLRYRSPRYAA